MAYPQRLKASFPRFNFTDHPGLTFEKPDTHAFQNLALAYGSMRKGGNSPCVLNASNEVVVDAFLKEKISFLEMSDIISTCLEKATFVANPTYEDYVDSDLEGRQLANDLIK